MPLFGITEKSRQGLLDLKAYAENPENWIDRNKPDHQLQDMVSKNHLCHLEVSIIDVEKHSELDMLVIYTVDLHDGLPLRGHLTATTIEFDANNTPRLQPADPALIHLVAAIMGLQEPKEVAVTMHDRLKATHCVVEFKLEPTVVA